VRSAACAWLLLRRRPVRRGVLPSPAAVACIAAAACVSGCVRPPLARWWGHDLARAWPPNRHRTRQKARTLREAHALRASPPARAARQLEPWFLKIHAAGTVPALVHGDKCVGGSEAICRYADKTFPGDLLVPAAASATVDKFVKLVADVGHEDLVNGFFLKTGHPGARARFP
jgi:hypothetical protein